MAVARRAQAQARPTGAHLEAAVGGAERFSTRDGFGAELELAVGAKERAKVGLGVGQRVRVGGERVVHSECALGSQATSRHSQGIQCLVQFS